jgi:hypothetical protein
MKQTAFVLSLALAAIMGCSSGEATGTGGAGGQATTTGTGGSGKSVTGVRGDRYCEILVGHLDGTNVHIDVYNTYLLNDCPDDVWSKLDPAAIKAEAMADVVVLNGPRYWVMDAFEDTKPIDAAPVTLGGLSMRLSGALDRPISAVMGGQAPYAPLSVTRTTTWVYDAGKVVYELVDPEGKIFDMQSYSVQKSPQTEASLAQLGAALKLPSGWQFRSRTLDAKLEVTAVDGLATIVQDDLANTYQLSQQ